MLIFVPGMHEIDRVIDGLKCLAKSRYLTFCTLHSDIALNVQMKAMARAQPGHRKVIVSTSIAESSITVSDVKFVVDFCLTKMLFFDHGTNFNELNLEW
jgi:ATP-dependent RNA helicase TDRD9